MELPDVKRSIVLIIDPQGKLMGMIERPGLVEQGFEVELSQSLDSYLPLK